MDRLALSGLHPAHWESRVDERWEHRWGSRPVNRIKGFGMTSEKTTAEEPRLSQAEGVSQQIAAILSRRAARYGLTKGKLQRLTRREFRTIEAYLDVGPPLGKDGIPTSKTEEILRDICSALDLPYGDLVDCREVDNISPTDEAWILLREAREEGWGENAAALLRQMRDAVRQQRSR